MDRFRLAITADICRCTRSRLFVIPELGIQSLAIGLHPSSVRNVVSTRSQALIPSRRSDYRDIASTEPHLPPVPRGVATFMSQVLPVLSSRIVASTRSRSPAAASCRVDSRASAGTRFRSPTILASVATCRFRVLAMPSSRTSTPTSFRRPPIPKLVAFARSRPRCLEKRSRHDSDDIRRS